MTRHFPQNTAIFPASVSIHRPQQSRIGENSYQGGAAGALGTVHSSLHS